VALAAFAMVFGALTDQIADPEGMSESRIDLFGGSLETVTDGFLGVMTMLTAGLAGIMVILGVQAVRTEETDGRAEPVLATAVSRVAWFGSYLVVLVAGLIGLLLVVGLASGTGAAVATGDASYLAKMTVAHLAHAPGVLVLLGLAAMLFGVLPRAIGATWAVLGLCLFSGIFGALTDIPQWLRNLLPMDHTGHPPLDDPPWVAMVLLLAIAAGLTAAGLAAFQRRDLETK
jgi:ABC-2 type transport system permease protein